MAAREASANPASREASANPASREASANPAAREASANPASRDASAAIVMLDLDAGPGFVEALQRVWESGDAAFPLDRRLPSAEARRVIETVKPAAVIEADGERRSLDGGQPGEAGDAIVVATSGTTGEPKAVIHTHSSIRASAIATSQALSIDPASDRWLACLPLAHVGGLGVVTRALLTDTALVVHPGFDPEAVTRAAAEGATVTSVVTRALTQIDPSIFRSILIGGAAPPPDRAANVIATYGMTETGSGCVYDGRPLPGVDLRADGDGQIEIRAPLLLRCYRTAAGDLDPKSANGWFPTGDIGRIEADGRLWIDGRAGDMIVSGGENVWPQRTERRLEAHPSIVEAAVFGRPDPEWGERLVAAVVIAGHQPEAEPPGLDEVRQWVRAELPVWYAPTDLVVVDALPRTSLGKVARSRLGDLDRRDSKVAPSRPDDLD